MPYRRRLPRAKRVARKYVSKRRAVRRAKKANFVKAVKAVIDSQAEDKMAYLSTGNGIVPFNSGISGNGDMLQVVPDISQGTADNQRIGDQVRIKNMKVSGYVRLYPKVQSGTFANEPKICNVVVRMFILSLKPAAGLSTAQAISGQLTALLKKGGATSAFTGALTDLQAPVNTDLFTVHADKKFYLTQDYTFLPTTATYTNAPVAMNVKDTVKFFNLNIRCKNKLLKYDQAYGGIAATNFGPFLCMGYVYLDGSSPDTFNTQVGLEMMTTMRFQDM